MSTQVDYTKPNVAGGACNLVVNGALAYFFFIYTFQNPDKGTCYARTNNEVAFPEVPVTTTGSGIDMVQTPLLGFTDVTDKFHSWFLYGFILNCVALVYSTLTFLYHATESVVVSYLANLIGCG